MAKPTPFLDLLSRPIALLFWREPTKLGGGSALDRRYRAVFTAEGRRGRRLEIGWRIIALLLIAALVSVVTTYPGMFFYHGLIALFIALGLLQLWTEAQPWRRGWFLYAFVAVDFALLAVTLLVQNPLLEPMAAPQMQLRHQGFIFFFALLASLSFTYRPWLILWGGLCGALFWSAGVTLLMMRPDSILAPPSGAAPEAEAAVLLAPTYIDVGVFVQEVTVFLIVAALLAANAMRSRRMVYRQAALEGERAHLSRALAPASAPDHAASAPEQEVAVLFVDIVGFSSWAETRPSAEAIAVLQRAHRRLAEIVLAHGGVLDRFIGDGLMASFGASPAPAQSAAPEGARRAIAASREMLAFCDAWSAERAAAGAAPLKLSIGLHYGEVVVGHLGSDGATDGTRNSDAADIAAGLEAMGRTLDCRAVLSAAAIAAASSEPSDAGPETKGFGRRGAQLVRGRAERIEVWSFE